MIRQSCVSFQKKIFLFQQDLLKERQFNFQWVGRFYVCKIKCPQILQKKYLDMKDAKIKLYDPPVSKNIQTTDQTQVINLRGHLLLSFIFFDISDCTDRYQELVAVYKYNKRDYIPNAINIISHPFILNVNKQLFPGYLEVRI